MPPLCEAVFIILLARLVWGGHVLLNDGDSAFHIRIGEWILNTLQIPSHDIFSFLGSTLTYRPHEWFAQVVMAFFYRLGGLTALVLVFAFLLSIFFAGLLKFLQHRFGTLLALTGVLLTALTSQIHWLARPHIFSWICMSFFYFLLWDYQDNRITPKKLFWLPPLMVLWANLHSGFILGVLFLGIFILANLWWWRTSAQKDRDSFKCKTFAFGGVFLLCGLASLCNPQGYHIWSVPFQLASSKTILANIQEFMPVNFQDPIFFQYYFMAILALLTTSRLRANLLEMLLFLIVTYMAFFSIRHVAIFAIVALPIVLKRLSIWINEGHDPCAEYLRGLESRISAIDAAAPKGAWSLAIIFAITVSLLLGKPHFDFDQQKAPINAIEFIKKEKPHGNMFNADEFGDYLIYYLYPQYQIFIDGRTAELYGEKVFKEYLQVLSIRPGWDKILKKYQINWIIYYSNSPFSLFMKTQKDWQLAYADKIASIFVRKIPEHAKFFMKGSLTNPT